MLCEVEGKNLACFRFFIAKLLRILSYYKVYLGNSGIFCGKRGLTFILPTGSPPLTRFF